MNTNEHEWDRLIEQVVGAAYEVSNVPGAGFLEKVYERALAHEIQSRGLSCRIQVGLPVSYKGVRVGHYFADLLVEDKLVVEIKCVERFGNEHVAQCINYLRASGHGMALLVNFQRPRVEWRRIIFG